MIGNTHDKKNGPYGKPDDPEGHLGMCGKSFVYTAERRLHRGPKRFVSTRD